MGKAGRIACIAAPMVLTIISFILLVVIMIGGWNRNDSNLSSLFYFRADTTGFKQNFTDSGILSVNLPGNIDDKLRTFLTQLTSSNSNNNLSDIYQIYLWNYCEGDKSGNDIKLTSCSDRQARFWFNPVEVWGLGDAGLQDLIPNELERGLNIYKGVSNWMFIAYAVAFFATAANIIVGLLAICSRLGSCITSFFAWFSVGFCFLSALTSTILFSVLTGTFNTVLKNYGIRLTIGSKMFALDWIAFAFSLAAALFWTISICCCSGKSDRKDRGEGKKGFSVPFAGRGYKPLGGDQNRNSYNQASNVEMSSFGANSPYKGRETAYEPFRHG